MSAIERDGFDRGIVIHHVGDGVGRLAYDAMRPVVHPDVVRYIDNVLARAA